MSAPWDFHPAFELHFSSGEVFRREELDAALAELAALLPGSESMALIAANGPGASLIELLSLRDGRPLLVLPSFFSPSQWHHALGEVRPRWIASDCLPAPENAVDWRGLKLWRTSGPGRPLPPQTLRITYTSGSTGQPKGICLDGHALRCIVESLCHTLRCHERDVFHSLLPQSILLECLTALYLPLYCGARAYVQSDVVNPRFVATQLLPSLQVSGASVTVFMPQMLQSICEQLEHGAKLPPRLRFAGVGGAHVGEPLLRRARSLDLPVFEGYGLTEACSVLCLNLPGAERLGSAGKPLQHVLQARCSPAGELQFQLPYVSRLLDGQAAAHTPDGWLATGDLGLIDDDGFVHIQGRLKAMFITSMGRNISPEWLESELLASGRIAAACVYGEGLPAPEALVVLREGMGLGELNSLRQRVNQTLGEHARLHRLHVVDALFFQQHDLLTANGRYRRRAVDELVRQHPDKFTSNKKGFTAIP